MTAIKAEWPDKFIVALAKHGVVSAAAKTARISRTAAYNKRDEDKTFAAAWDDAIEQAADMLEREAFRRAHTGTLKPIYQGGEKVGSVREYSDTLMIFLLKGARPQKYRENHKVEVSGTVGTIAIREVVIERSTASEEDA